MESNGIKFFGYLSAQMMSSKDSETIVCIDDKEIKLTHPLVFQAYNNGNLTIKYEDKEYVLYETTQDYSLSKYKYIYKFESREKSELRRINKIVNDFMSLSKEDFLKSDWAHGPVNCVKFRCTTKRLADLASNRLWESQQERYSKEGWQNLATEHNDGIVKNCVDCKVTYNSLKCPRCGK